MLLTTSLLPHLDISRVHFSLLNHANPIPVMMISEGIDCLDRTLELCDVPTSFTDSDLVSLLGEFKDGCKFSRLSKDNVVIIFSNRAMSLRAKEHLNKMGFFSARFYEGDPSLVPHLPAKRPSSSAITAGRIISRSLGIRQPPEIARKNQDAYNREKEKLELEDKFQRDAHERQMRYWNDSYDG